MEQQLAECQRVIGYHFSNLNLLEIALTHSSLRTPDRECNERLEFLGDSVLGLVVTEELYRLLPDQAEGELTRLKSAVVSRGALYRASTELGLARFAEFARGVKLLMHEVWLSEEEAAVEEAAKTGHSDARAVAEMAKRAAVGKLWVVHHHPRRAPEAVAAMAARMAESAGLPVEVPVEGRLVGI